MWPEVVELPAPAIGQALGLSWSVIFSGSQRLGLLNCLHILTRERSDVTSTA
jgi:hypothetical protein